MPLPNELNHALSQPGQDVFDMFFSLFSSVSRLHVQQTLEQHGDDGDGADLSALPALPALPEGVLDDNPEPGSSQRQNGDSQVRVLHHWTEHPPH